MGVPANFVLFQARVSIKIGGLLYPQGKRQIRMGFVLVTTFPGVTCRKTRPPMAGISETPICGSTLR
jgi:hypothetical protein